MKKILMTLMLVFTAASASWAYQDSYSYLWEGDVYPSLIRSIKNNEDEQTVLAAYRRFMDEDFSEADKSRLEYHMVRYYMDNGNKEEAEKHLEREKSFFNAIPGNEDPMKRDIAELDMLSAEYYVDKKLSKGLGSSNLTKQLYKEHPDEYYVALTEAFRLLNTPHIAGGSPKRALELFERIRTEEEGMNDLDRYSLYSGLGMSSYERKKYDDSRRYFDIATGIYGSDTAMDEYLGNLAKKGK